MGGLGGLFSGRRTGAVKGWVGGGLHCSTVNTDTMPSGGPHTVATRQCLYVILTMLILFEEKDRKLQIESFNHYLRAL